MLKIHEKEEEEMNEKNENANCLQLSDEPLITADQVRKDSNLNPLLLHVFIWQMPLSKVTYIYIPQHLSLI